MFPSKEEECSRFTVNGVEVRVMKCLAGATCGHCDYDLEPDEDRCVICGRELPPQTKFYLIFNGQRTEWLFDSPDEAETTARDLIINGENTSAERHDANGENEEALDGAAIPPEDAAVKLADVFAVINRRVAEARQNHGAKRPVPKKSQPN